MNKKLRYLPYVFFIALLPAMIFRDFSPANELRYLSIADEAIRQGGTSSLLPTMANCMPTNRRCIWRIIMLGKMIFGKHQMWFLALFSFVPRYRNSACHGPMGAGYFPAKGAPHELHHADELGNVSLSVGVSAHGHADVHVHHASHCTVFGRHTHRQIQPAK